MSGNVLEWCLDYSHSDYTGATTDGSAWLNPIGSKYVLRGGGWNAGASACRVSARDAASSDDGYEDYGFRLLLK